MRIFVYKTLAEYVNKHPDAKSALEEWFDKTKDANWINFADVKNTFHSADNVGNKRYVFNIKGNNYRLVAIVLFVPKFVYIRFIGTHDEYSKIKDCSIL
ncbi:MAG: type II toxin-antitoxin system HigB family toxin [Bacteroidales bacterium]|nr:type II toxin-antitoxin system HigB family toxin [Bacteroidales bacterium]